MKKLLVASIFLCFLVKFLLASSVPLAWDASTSSNISGYKVYYGNASRSYSTIKTIGNQTTYTVDGLGMGTWYFAVTAFDKDGNESDFSNEVSKFIAESSPSSLILLTVSSLRSFGVVLQCITTEKTSSILRYSLVQPNSGWTTIVATPTVSKTKHQAVIYLPTKTGTVIYWRYEWTVTNASGKSSAVQGTFLVN